MEGFTELLATALYRTGRQSQALDALRALRRSLRDELGVDPSPAVSRLEADLLRQEPGLSAGPAEDVPDGPVAHGVHGRDAEIVALRRAWSAARAGTPTAVTLTGEPGIGKTA